MSKIELTPFICLHNSPEKVQELEAYNDRIDELRNRYLNNITPEMELGHRLLQYQDIFCYLCDAEYNYGDGLGYETHMSFSHGANNAYNIQGINFGPLQIIGATDLVPDATGMIDFDFVRDLVEYNGFSI